MTITRTDVKLLIPFLLFVILGLWGSYSFPFIESHKAFTLSFKWFIVPSLILGVIYSYYSVFLRGPQQAKWRKVVGLFTLTLIFALLFLRSFQGYLVLCNAYIGKQEELAIRGTVHQLDYPKKKKPLNTYAIVVGFNNKEQSIKLDVPSNGYIIGQVFERKMRKGSLGLLYSF